MPNRSRSKNVELSVIMPVYNEGLHIHANILKVCNALKGKNYEIIVVDDGSSDNSPLTAIARKK